MKYLQNILDKSGYALFVLPFLAWLRLGQMQGRSLGNVHNPYQKDYMAVCLPAFMGALLLIVLLALRKDLPLIVEKFRFHSKIYLAGLLVFLGYNVISEYLMVMDTTLCRFFPPHTILTWFLFFFSFLLALLGVFLFALGVSAPKQVFVWFWSLMFSSLGALAILSGDVNFIKKYSLLSASQAGDKIIQALDAYKAEHKEYPQSLGQVIPRYLSKMPSTGMCRYPRFVYAKDPPSSEGDHRGYQLSIEAERGVFVPERALFYYPSQQYPESMNLKEINDWRYIHL